jgi:cyclopropane fatty-acyl-phospholipid synthase-like methyltransferase
VTNPLPHHGHRSTFWRSPDELYTGQRPPWDIGRPQPAFLALADAGVIRGRVLDVGCGTGEHVLMCAGRGLNATGVDLAPTALATARAKADHRHLTARFLVRDARLLAELAESFDTVLDCGLFHIFDGADRVAFVASLRAALVPGGRYLMLCFSDAQPGDTGPHRMTRDEILTAFREGWRVDSIQAATIETLSEAHGVRAWLAMITRT